MFRGVGIVLVLGCASCSLLFDEQAPSGHDAGTIDAVDAPSQVADATPIDTDALVCGQPLDNTIDLFEVEDIPASTTITLSNSVSSNANASLLSIGGSPAPHKLVAEEGPPTCGMALGNDTDGFARIPGRADHMAGPISVDFWFRFSDQCVPEKALFSKDRKENHLGDLTVFCLPSVSSYLNSHIVLRLEDGTNADYLCSDALAPGDWHHLVVSHPNDGVNTIKLFVDGIASSVVTDIDFPASWESVACRMDTKGASTLISNSSPWLWGATGDTAPAGTFAANRFIGDLDSFRIRAAETTLEQAQAIYQSVIRP